MSLRLLVSTLAVGHALQMRAGPMRMSAAGEPAIDRRSMIAQTAALVATVPFAAYADVYGVNSELPTGEKDINKFLKTLGYPEMPKVSGLSPVVEYIGTAAPANIDGQKVRGRQYDGILLVRFLFPSFWIVAKPDITENGEAGTIGANNFVKGDSMVRPHPGAQRGKRPSGQTRAEARLSTVLARGRCSPF